MDGTRIFHIKQAPATALYCGRVNKTYNVEQSKWANPYVIGKDGDRTDVIEKHRLWINSQPDLLQDLPELRGQVLSCWCHYPSENCHCATLIELSESRHIRNWFSNMLPFERSLWYQGIEFKTVENFYQAMKLPKCREDLRRQIAAMSPFEAKKQIRDKNLYAWANDWKPEKSLRVMDFALRHKFAKGTDWFRKLMLTRDAQGGYYEICEWNSWSDKFWGKDLKTREGENNLGKLLMKIREENK